MSELVVTVNPGKLKLVSESVSSCNICDKTFLDRNELYWHIRKQHLRLGWPALPFKCDLCGAAYIRKVELEIHIRDQHRSSPKPTIGESDGEHNLGVGKTSTGKENTDVGTMYASPRPPIEEIDDKEGDKASVKHKKQEKNDPSWLEKSANMKITPSMYNVNVDVVKRERYQGA